MGLNDKEWKLFCDFSLALVRSKDLDPTYPVLKLVFKKRGFDQSTSLLYLLIYLGFYDLGETERYFQESKRFAVPLDTKSFNKATERRGFRGNSKANNLFLRYEFFQKFCEELWSCSFEPTEGWKRTRGLIESFENCGSWASFKMADLLKNVLDFPITSPDFGTGGGSATAGPIPGLVRLTGLSWKECSSNIELQQNLFSKACERVPFKGMEEMETALCDYNSFRKGGYYVGHDIDKQMEMFKNLPAVYWETRREVFGEEFLGELNGWTGVRKHLYGKITFEVTQ